MSTLKSSNRIAFSTLNYPLDKKENRSINVANSMLYQIKKLGITIKDEKFLLSFTKSLNEVERDPSAPHLCFDHDPRRTAQLLQRLKINLSEGGQNFSLSKLGYLLALTLGFDKYDGLLKQLDAYQCFIKKPWYIYGKKITKPLIRHNGKDTYIFLPLMSISPSSRYMTQDMSVSIILASDLKTIGCPIIFSYRKEYHGCEFRSFGTTQEDAMAWLIVHAIHQLQDVRLWNVELNYHRATARYEAEKEKFE